MSTKKTINTNNAWKDVDPDDVKDVIGKVIKIVKDWMK